MKTALPFTRIDNYITVEDVIKHIVKLPPDLPVMWKNKFDSQVFCLRHLDNGDVPFLNTKVCPSMDSFTFTLASNFDHKSHWNSPINVLIIGG